ncbi:MAG: hypothetical protein V4674_02065 [Patescibacteria group bacterium]
MKSTFFAAAALLSLLSAVPSGAVYAVHTPVEKATSTTPKVLQKSRLSEFQKEKTVQYAREAADRLSVLSQKQEDLLVRIDSRVRKFEEERRNVEDAKQSLIEAKAALEGAKTAIESIEENVTEVLGFGNLKEALTEARLSIKDAQDAVLLTHKKIGATIDALELAADLERNPNTSSEESR